MQLIVLGMHRSGTSVLARLLNLMGCYFGPEGSSTGANVENPKGFWERRDVRKLNDAVLHGMDCDWNRVAAFDIGNIPVAVAQHFAKNASRLVLELDAHRPWFLKEPRLCLLFPIWRPLFEVPTCIHILRHPVEVASSLNKRNNIPIAAGLAIWEKYVRSAIDSSNGLASVVVSHRSLMQHPLDEVERLVNGLREAGVANLRSPADSEVLSFIQTDLYREREQRDDLLAYRNAPQVKLFEQIMSERSVVSIRPRPSSSAMLEVLAHYEQSIGPLVIPQAPELLEVALRKKLESRDEDVSRLSRTLAQVTQQFELVEGDRKSLIAALQNEAQQAKAQNAELEARLANSLQEQVRARGLQLEVSATIESLTNSVRQMTVAEEEHASVVTTLHENAQQTKAQNAELEVQLANSLQELTSVVVTLQEEAQQTKAQNAELEDRLANALHALDRARCSQQEAAVTIENLTTSLQRMAVTEEEHASVITKLQEEARVQASTARDEVSRLVALRAGEEALFSQRIATLELALNEQYMLIARMSAVVANFNVGETAPFERDCRKIADRYQLIQK